MARSVLIFALFLFGGEATGVLELLEASAGDDSCAGGGGDCQCPPGCGCLCCFHNLRPMMPLNPPVPGPVPSDPRVIVLTERDPSLAEPGDILHVPKQEL